MLKLQQIELLRMRNKIVFLSFITILFILCSLNILSSYSDFHVLLNALFIFFIPSIVGKMLKIKPITIQWLLVICGNLSIFYINVFLLSSINFIFFIFYLLLISIYQSQKMNTILSIVTLFEMIVLFYVNNFKDLFIPKQHFTMFVFFWLLCATIFAIHTKCIKQCWYNFEQMKLKKEQKLLSQESYLQLFFEHANDCIAVLGLDNRIIDVNPAFEEVYGWKRTECIGKILPLVPPENQVEAEKRYFDLLDGKSIRFLETKDMKKDGTVFDVAISLSPIYNRNGKMVATSVISRDISYEKENEQLILQSEKLKLAGEIAAGVAHEIRNPLTVISGFVQMMNNDKDSIYHSYTEIIQSEIDRINLIIGEFLVLSKPQAEQLKKVSIDKTIKNVSDFFHLEFLNRDIIFSMNIKSGENLVLANENQLKQVFINIIKNAIEAIEMKNVKGEIHCSIDQDNHNIIHITISDNGIGMSDHLLNRIFDPFFTTKAKGTGLGMLITKKIIQDHVGKIDIDSKETYGTTVKIQLPSIKKASSDI